MLRRPTLLILLVAGCGDQPLDPVAPPVSARAINLSGMPGEVTIWMDGEVIAGGLVDTQPSPALSIGAGTHTFAYSSAGGSQPETSVELVVPPDAFSVIALMRGSVGPGLRVISYPIAREGRITVRALNGSDEPAGVIVRGLTGVPGGVELTMQLEPGAFEQSDLPGATVVRVGNTQISTPTAVIILTARAAAPLEDFKSVGYLGGPISGEVRTVVFHRSPVFAPDVYSF